MKLVERAEKSYFVRPVKDIIQMLEAAYGPLPGAVAEDLALKIIGIARSLNGGNMTQAMLKTLYLRLPEIPAGNMAKMGRVGVAPERFANDLKIALCKAQKLSQKAVEKVNNNTATEPRDEYGRWTRGGGTRGSFTAGQGNIEQMVVTAPREKYSPNSVYNGKKYNVTARKVGNIIYNEM